MTDQTERTADDKIRDLEGFVLYGLKIQGFAIAFTLAVSATAFGLALWSVLR